MWGCVKPSEYCPPLTSINLSDAKAFSENPDSHFRFPVDNLTDDQLIGAVFASYSYASSYRIPKNIMQSKTIICLREAQYMQWPMALLDSRILGEVMVG